LQLLRIHHGRKEKKRGDCEWPGKGEGGTTPSVSLALLKKGKKRGKSGWFGKYRGKKRKGNEGALTFVSHRTRPERGEKGREREGREGRKGDVRRRRERKTVATPRKFLSWIGRRKSREGKGKEKGGYMIAAHFKEKKNVSSSHFSSICGRGGKRRREETAWVKKRN